MRCTILWGIFCVVLSSTSADAGCIDIASVTNDQYFIDISDGGCGPEVMIGFAEMKKNKSGKSQKQAGTWKEYAFNQECTFIDRKSIKCKSGGRTPLAGATYKFVRHGTYRCEVDGNRHPEYRYQCVSGCSRKTVPAFLIAGNGCE